MKGVYDVCPKCGTELKKFYLKQECPKCGLNLFYYSIEHDLEADADAAEKEYLEFWKKVYKLDKLHLVEKYYEKQNKPAPWEE